MAGLFSRMTVPSRYSADETTSRCATPAISTAPVVPSTSTSSPSSNILTDGTESTIGMDEMTAPVATIVSADSFTTAAGATPWTARSYMTNEPTVLPFPRGKTRTAPATLPPFPARISPVEPSTPPRKLSGSSSLTTLPRARPGDMGRPSTIT